MNCFSFRLISVLLLCLAHFLRAQPPTPDEVMAQAERAFGAAQAPSERGVPGKRIHLSGLMRDVSKVLSAMTREQKDRLRQLSPSLDLMVERADARQEGRAPTRSLPTTFTNLTQTEFGKTCIVHYTTSAGPDQTTQTYAKLVATQIDAATRRLARFGKPLYDGPPGDKMHVYVHDISDYGVTTGEASDGTPQTSATYMEIDIGLSDADVIATCFHEFMHAIQYAYNVNSQAWFVEGQAVWVECDVLRDNRGLAGYMADAKSVCNRPDLPIFDNSYDRNYTTAVFQLYLTRKRGDGIMRRWLNATVGTNDSLSALQQVLDGGAGRAFSGLYRQYLAGLYRKQLPGVPDEVFRDVPIEGEFIQLGIDLNATLPPTGAKFWLVRPDERIPNEYVIGKVEPSSGAPEMVLEKKPERFRPLKVITPPDADDVPRFKSAGEMLAILTDTSALNEMVPNTTITAQLLSPYLKFKLIEPMTPINAGDRSNMPITYDLLGLPPSVTIFKIDFRLTEKGPGVADRASQETNARTGEDQKLHPFFQSAADRGGTYRFLWSGLTPVKSYSMKKIPQSRTSIRTQVVVNPPAAAPFTQERKRLLPESVALAVDE